MTADCDRPAPPVTDKARMYDLLAAGAFGNTTRQWFSLAAWEASADYRRYADWGVRSLVPGGPCRLYCPRAEVATTVARSDFRAAGYNLSVMVDAVLTVTLWAEVWDSPAGLVVYGVRHPPKGASWRAVMPAAGRHWEGVVGRAVLSHHLNANARDDLDILRDRFPGHVYELSATEEEFGTVAGRNAIIWEVRNY